MYFGHLISEELDLSYYVTNALNIILAFATIYLFYNIIHLTTKEQELDNLKNEQQHNESLSTFLRELRHDLNNQIFVAKGLLELGKVQEASDYCNDINIQFAWMEGLLALNQPELASLILNKLLEAKNLGIAVDVKVQTKQVPLFSGQVFTRTLGNLLDNAIEALRSITDMDKKLLIDISSINSNFIIKVANTGEILHEVSEKMFETGFTTKPDKVGHGLGLHIVASLMENLEGKIIHQSKDGMTIFELIFPM